MRAGSALSGLALVLSFLVVVVPGAVVRVRGDGDDGDDGNGPLPPGVGSLLTTLSTGTSATVSSVSAVPVSDDLPHRPARAPRHRPGNPALRIYAWFGLQGRLPEAASRMRSR